MLSRKHLVAKSILYRIYATIISILVIQWFTGNWGQSASIGASVNVVKVATYYLYESVWLHFAMRNFNKIRHIDGKMVYENATIKFADEMK